MRRWRVRTIPGEPNAQRNVSWVLLPDATILGGGGFDRMLRGLLRRYARNGSFPNMRVDGATRPNSTRTRQGPIISAWPFFVTPPGVSSGSKVSVVRPTRTYNKYFRSISTN